MCLVAIILDNRVLEALILGLYVEVGIVRRTYKECGNTRGLATVERCYYDQGSLGRGGNHESWRYRGGGKILITNCSVCTRGCVRACVCGLGSSVPEMGTETKYIFLIISPNITGVHLTDARHGLVMKPVPEM